MDSHKDIFIKRVSLLRSILKTKDILNYGQKNKIHTQFYFFPAELSDIPILLFHYEDIKDFLQNLFALISGVKIEKLQIIAKVLRPCLKVALKVFCDIAIIVFTVVLRFATLSANNSRSTSLSPTSPSPSSASSRVTLSSVTIDLELLLTLNGSGMIPDKISEMRSLERSEIVTCLGGENFYIGSFN